MTRTIILLLFTSLLTTAATPGAPDRPGLESPVPPRWSRAS